MTISSTVNRLAYTGNGSTTAFSVSFKFIDPEDLVLYVDDDLQVLDTDYTVSGGAGSTGTVTFSTAPVSATRITILRDPAVLQETDYSENDNFPAETHERALDRLTMIAQRNRDLLERSLTLADSAPVGVSTQLPAPSANDVIAWNADATALESKSIGSVATSIVGANIIRDVFSGDGTSVSFTLSSAPQTENNTQVFISGIYQQKSEYSVDGTTIEFNDAPPSGTSNIEVVQMQAVLYPIAEIHAGTVNQASLADSLDSILVKTTDADAVLRASDVGTSAGDIVALDEDGKLPALDGSLLVNLSSSLPSQSGNQNKVLKTNGTAASWESPVSSGTAINTTSGTAHDFTGIPSWVSKITLSIRGVSFASSGQLMIQLGTSGGIVSSGYVSVASYVSSSGLGSASLYTTGFVTLGDGTASNDRRGSITFSKISSDVWLASGNLACQGSGVNFTQTIAGEISLGSALTTLRVTSNTGDTFDAGSVNILYE